MLKANDALLSARDVTLNLNGKLILDRVNLDVRRGDSVILLSHAEHHAIGRQAHRAQDVLACRGPDRARADQLGAHVVQRRPALPSFALRAQPLDLARECRSASKQALAFFASGSAITDGVVDVASLALEFCSGVVGVVHRKSQKVRGKTRRAPPVGKTAARDGRAMTTFRWRRDFGAQGEWGNPCVNIWITRRSA